VKVSVEAEPQEIIPPKVWFQLKHAFVSIAAQYGIRVQVREDPENVMALDRRYFEWIDEQDKWPGDGPAR